MLPSPPDEKTTAHMAVTFAEPDMPSSSSNSDVIDTESGSSGADSGDDSADEEETDHRLDAAEVRS